MTHDQMVQVILADKQGIPLELQHCAVREWNDYDGSGFDFTTFNYRVKPKVIYVNEYAHGPIAAANKVSAEAFAQLCPPIRTAVPYAELKGQPHA